MNIYLFKLASLSNLFAASSPKNWSELMAFAPPNFFTAESPSSAFLLILMLPLPPNEFELPKKHENVQIFEYKFVNFLCERTYLSTWHFWA